MHLSELSLIGHVLPALIDIDMEFQGILLVAGPSVRWSSF